MRNIFRPQENLSDSEMFIISFPQNKVMVKLFAIKQKFSEKIYSKQKRIEYRRQNVNVKKGEKCYIYSSSPAKAIDGHFTVGEKIRLPLKELWRKTRKQAGISYKVFREYFEGCFEGTALVLVKVRRFARKIELEEMRSVCSNFRPPQSYYDMNLSMLRKIEGMIMT